MPEFRVVRLSVLLVSCLTSPLDSRLPSSALFRSAILGMVIMRSIPNLPYSELSPQTEVLVRLVLLLTLAKSNLQALLLLLSVELPLRV